MSEKRNERGFVFRLKVPTRNAAARSSLEKGSRQDTAKNFQSWEFRNSSPESWFSYPRTCAGCLKHADWKSYEAGDGYARIHGSAPEN
jgi:hypothetical protein